MPITPLPTPPTTGDPVNFDSRADNFLAALPTFQTEANALETNVNSKEASATTAATNAQNSATSASTSATNAQNSATAAATSETNAAASFDSFDDRYLGAKAADPTLDNDGNALLEGAIYWNTGTKLFRVYNGTAWEGANLGLPPDGSITNAMLAFDGGSFGYRNRIIGGDFTTNPWQRGTSFAAVVTGSYTADRWAYGQSGGGAVSILKTVDAPTAAEAGVFTQHCLHLDVTTADAVVDSTDLYTLSQRIEGFNAASLGFGQAGTRYITLSFWVKSSKTGINCVSFRNSANDRSYVKEYTVISANTWEKKTLTIPVDTAGAWLYDSGIGLRFDFTLSAGTNFQTGADAWLAGDLRATANQVNNLDATTNDFKIALIQLEAGQTATPFETRDVGTERLLCERYALAWGQAAKGIWVSTTTCRLSEQTAVRFRSSPTAALLSSTPTVEDWNVTGYVGAGSTITSNGSSVREVDLAINGFTGTPGARVPAFATGGLAILSAEL